jgi:hypothetical protein
VVDNSSSYPICIDLVPGSWILAEICHGFPQILQVSSGVLLKKKGAGTFLTAISAQYRVFDRSNTGIVDSIPIWKI